MSELPGHDDGPSVAASMEEALTRLAHLALARWGLRGSHVRLLKYRENAVFGIRQPHSGEQWVLRVHRPGYHSDQAILSELDWMQALHDAGIDVPVPVPTASGKRLTLVAHAAITEPRQCDLLSWVAGTPIGAIERGGSASAAQVEDDHYQAGRLSAAVHEHAQRWTPPAQFQRPLMDADGLVGQGAYLGHYGALRSLAPADLALLDQASARVRAQLETFGYGPDRFGLVHGDFLPENLLRDGDVVRLIDFDDCGYGWHLMDMATALFFLLGEPVYPAAERGFIAGYRSVRPLPDAHVEMLPTFFLARGITYLGWLATRQETAEAQAIGPAVIAAVLALAADYLED